MTALTAAQKQLVNDHLFLADLLACKFRSKRLRGAEKLSAAYLGLCRAATRYVPGMISFRTYASQRIWGAMKDDCETTWRGDREYDLGEVLAVELDSRDPFHGVDQSDEIEHLLNQFKPSDRRWLEAFLETGNWWQAARRLGMGNSAAGYARQRLIPRLEAMAAKRGN
jgi:hypothetical protein